MKIKIVLFLLGCITGHVIVQLVIRPIIGL